MTDTIFALDIGTRSVVGIVLQHHHDKFEIVDIVFEEHSERAMLDGQIHDILAVSKVIGNIKQKLEQKYGTIQTVSVAAAGRALKTNRAQVSVNIVGKPMMTNEDILHFELQAVQEAQMKLVSTNNSDRNQQYYCVGYSVLQYKLDHEIIGNLIDQQGNVASVEVIATFLPRVVVESLIAALHRAGLEMEALTLEPIAAINVLIPQSMRRLNVALVDIGAGTSDIAITDSGTVTAYGMVPVAGDEITEAVSDQFLLDFPLAEKAKRDLYGNDEVIIQDILGFETTVSREDFITQISYSIEKLASAITNEILQLNGKAPKAVMLVGGGSLTPELPKHIASKLNLPENRVAIRGVDAIQNITIQEGIQKGPELVTPIGIAITSKQSPVHYIHVTINDQSVRLFDIKKLTVGDCLLAAGIELSKLYGRPGNAIIVSVNGKKMTLPGEYGEPPIIFINGQTCKLDHPIRNQDQIIVKKGRDGASVSLTIRELLDILPAKVVTINGKIYKIEAAIYQNNRLVTYDEIVSDHDDISWNYPMTIKELLNYLNINEEFNESIFIVHINNQKVSFPSFSAKIFRNGQEATINSNFNHGDVFELKHAQQPTIKQIAEQLKVELFEFLPVRYNEQTIILSKEKNKFYHENNQLNEDDVIHHGDVIQIKEIKPEPFIFQDLFRYVDIEIPKDVTGGFKLLKNDEEVTFFEPLTPGDALSIVWTSELSH